MVISLALIFLVGLTAAAICRRIALPRIIGMLLAGILLGPFALNALDPGLLAVSADLRANRPYYHSAEGWFISGPFRTADSGTPGCYDVLRSCHL